MANLNSSVATIVGVNMGYGHERAAYALKHVDGGRWLNANDYPGIPDRDKAYWEKTRKMYELVSRIQQRPWIGPPVFRMMDSFQRILPFYPRRDLSTPTLQLRQTYYSIEKLGIGRHLVEHLSRKPRPLICTFFHPAFAAEVYDYPEDIYCVICDADMSRAWVPRDPKKSRIKYFAPNGRVVERLKLYGIREDQIFFTGFPLPQEMLGTNNETILYDLKARLCNLDPNGIFLNRYFQTLETYLGLENCVMTSEHPLTLTFAVGGAGAQRDLALQIMESLKHALLRKRLHLHLVAGVNTATAKRFEAHADAIGLKSAKKRQLHIDHWPDRATYFTQFTKLLRTTDILWTKPSELSFYTGLGIPIIMAPSIGSQEDFNRIWLKSVGGGITQNDPRYVNEWLFDWIESGGLARMAWNGYIEAPTHGTQRIEDVLRGQTTKLEKLPLIV